MANLTGLMLARDQKLKFEERVRGVAYVSDQTHASVAKGLRILGFRNEQIRKVQSDGRFRMDVAALIEAVRKDREDELLPFLVVATCGTTNTGSVDPMDEIADFAQSQNMWMHVDGAYGAVTGTVEVAQITRERRGPRRQSFLGCAQMALPDLRLWYAYCTGEASAC